jgi:hypothetical protein
MLKSSTYLLVCLVLVNQAFAQRISVPVSAMLPSPIGSGSYTYPNGVVASAQIVTTCSCTPGTSTGKNATTVGTSTGGTYSGITIPGYLGDTAKGMLTALHAAGTAFNGTSDGTLVRPGTGSGNLTGALGFWIHFSDSVLINNILAFDIDGTTAGNPNREWISVFGYNTKDTSVPVLFNASGGTKTANAGMLALTSTWGTMVQAKVPAVPSSQLPTAANVQIRRSSFTSPAGTADATLDDTTSQVLFDPVGGRMITDLFVLWGLFDDFGGLPTAQAASLGPIVAFIPVPLAIRLNSFSGRIEDNRAVLYWNTADEDPNDRFELQRSADGVSFTSVAVRNVSPQAQNSYSYQDPVCGDHFYRLKVIQSNGNSSFSNTVHLHTDALAASIKVLPNPVTDMALLDLTGLGCPAQVNVYDVSGKSLLQYPFAESGLLQIDCAAWQAGRYFADIKTKDGLSRTVSFIKK